MDFEFSEQDEVFRKEARAWLEGNVPEALRGKAFASSRADVEEVRRLRAWQKTMWEAGYVGMNWPREFGGRGAPLTEQIILYQEMARAESPQFVNRGGLSMLGPTLMKHGTPAQQKRHLQHILTADELWCQGFSEPNAGSDLANLATRAVLEDDAFVVNGQKVWTSMAHVADWCFLLVRTDPDAPKHKGISFLLVDMKTPGITVRPLRQLTGEAEFNEVFFDNVRVPRDNLVAALVIGEQALQMSAYRSLTKILRGGEPGPEGSTSKLFWSQLDQELALAATEVIGPYAQIAEGSPWAPDEGQWEFYELLARASSIRAGTTEILKNILGERVLGLPKD